MDDLSFEDGLAVETHMAPDEKRCVWIIQRPNGLCRFVEMTLEHDPCIPDPFWVGSHESGLYPDVPSASAAAIQEIPWLRQMKAGMA